MNIKTYYKIVFLLAVYFSGIKKVALLAQDIEFIPLGYGAFVEEKKGIKVKQGDITKHIIFDADTLPEITDSIPLWLGVEFGFDFMIKSKAEGNPNVKVKWEIPGYVVIEGQTKNSNVILYDYAARYNSHERLALTLSKPEDLIPGTWRLTVTYAADKSYTQEFYLYWEKQEDIK